MIRLAVFGAGGKMGTRISLKLRNHPGYQLYLVETNEKAKERVLARGQRLSSAPEAAENADVVILAVPDVKLGAAASDIVPLLRPGALLMLLDPAAAYYGQVPIRQGIGYFVAHPCHPPVFNDETDPDAKKDYFGGLNAKQSVVCALLNGEESDYALGERIARDIFSPILRTHRITVEQMTMLEPALIETIAAPVVLLLREAMDEAVRRGVPYEAARDFMLGHINIELAIAFGEAGNPFSDAAMVAIDYGRKHFLNDNWKTLFDRDSLTDQVGTMLKPGCLRSQA